MGPETSHVHKITYGPLIDMALCVMCLIGANPLLGPLEGLDYESLNFFGPKQLSVCSSGFRAPKSLDIHGPTLPMALVMDLPPSNTLHTGPYQSEVHK